jgi:hypothetical protein
MEKNYDELANPSTDTGSIVWAIRENCKSASTRNVAFVTFSVEKRFLENVLFCLRYEGYSSEIQFTDGEYVKICVTWNSDEGDDEEESVTARDEEVAMAAAFAGYDDDVIE